MAEGDEYDYVVVGSGPAGSVVANRLSQRHRVLLLEAGAPGHEWVDVPGGFLEVTHEPTNLWKDLTVAGQHVDGRSIAMLQGHLLGGSSAVNGMLYVRGHRSDYDRWSADGCSGWSWLDLLPSYLRHTQHQEARPGTYGTGELRLSQVAEPHPTSTAFLDAAGEAGLRVRQDLNDGDQEGAAYATGAVFGGRRQTAAVAFLDPVAGRETLHVVTGARVRRVLFEGVRAVGVEVQSATGRWVATCRREVVLSAGAINSPQILQHSGVGPRARLASLGIEVVSDLQGVGENLQDHLFGHLKFRLREDSMSLNGQLGDPAALQRHLETWRTEGTGPLTTTSSQVLAFFRSGEAHRSPNVQVAMRPLSWSIGARGVPELDTFPGMMASAINARPHSRGTVAIVSDDPDERPRIDPGYLSDPRDVEVLVAGVRRVRRIMSRPTMAERVLVELDPGDELVSDLQLEDYLRSTAATVYHPAGTCRMGSDPGSVVDPQLRVRGVTGLRVVDASVMPTITSGNTMAPAFVIGQRGAELVLEG